MWYSIAPAIDLAEITCRHHNFNTLCLQLTPLPAGRTSFTRVMDVEHLYCPRVLPGEPAFFA